MKNDIAIIACMDRSNLIRLIFENAPIVIIKKAYMYISYTPALDIKIEKRSKYKSLKAGTVRERKESFGS